MDYLKIYEEEHIKNGLSYSQIRKKYNIPRGTWDYHIRLKLGKSADRRKFRCNDNFFDVIDSEIKAYLLGVLYADGYIANDGRIGILLNIKDKELIRNELFFRIYLKLNKSGSLKATTYHMNKTMDIKEIVTMLLEVVSVFCHFANTIVKQGIYLL